jgi:ADP-ribosyl-[dinitrogen reductase] hydrolase
MGDAVGAPLEFTRKGQGHVTGPQAGGPFNLKAGEWTDDTSMALALADSLLQGAGQLDPADLLCRFSNWYRRGVYSHNGRCFDIGNQTRTGIEQFERTRSLINGTEPEKQGNGGLMRMAPVVLVATGLQNAMDLAKAQCQTTHANNVCVLDCMMLADALWHNIHYGADQKHIPVGYMRTEPPESTGQTTVTARVACWAFSTSSSYQEAVLKAVNLGGDSDTAGAVTGMLAGSYYGMSGIPEDWLQQLAWRDRIAGMARQLFELTWGEQ